MALRIVFPGDPDVFLRGDRSFGTPTGAEPSDGDKVDITVTAGGLTWTIDPNAVTNAKLRDSAGFSVVGKATTGTGDPADIVAADETVLGRTAAGNLGFSQVATGQIANDAVTYAKMQNVSATSRFLGRITAAAGDAEELTGTQATTLLDAFTSALKGLAPASGGGSTNFLRADGTWSVPGGGGGGADPPEGSYAPGTYTIATGKFRVAVKQQQFTTTQRLTLQGTARLSVHN